MSEKIEVCQNCEAAEAGAAAMREALEKLSEDGCFARVMPDDYAEDCSRLRPEAPCSVCIAQRAIATDAGAGLLARLREHEAHAWRQEERISALVDDVERAEAERDEWKDRALQAGMALSAAEAERDAARAQRDNLREELNHAALDLTEARGIIARISDHADARESNEPALAWWNGLYDLFPEDE